jgi:hypothetical protein
MGCAGSNGFKEVSGLEGEYSLETENYYVFTRKSGPELMVTMKGAGSVFEVLDTDNDKKLDLLRYSVFDKDGNYLYTVEDYAMDGSYDIRNNFNHRDQLNSEDLKMEVNYFGCWYRVIKGERGAIIKVGDQEIPISLVNGKPTYNNSFKPQGGVSPCSDPA